jgi:deazaflavin-dependent oxidoreductase (nitroreductase family)
MRLGRFKTIRRVQRFLVNPAVTRALLLGIPDPGDALLETTGRRTGLPRLTAVCDCLEGDTFWVIAQGGRGASWVKNIEVNPQVRVNVRRGSKSLWLHGRACVVDGDDTAERGRALGQGHPARQLCLEASRAVATHPLTVRIDVASRDRAGNETAG